MNKKLISVLATIVLFGTLTGVSEAELSTPFGYTSTGVDIVDFELDFKDIEVMLDVQVTEIPSTLEITFEREFFDSTNLDQDSEFPIIAVTEEIPTTQVEQTGKINELIEENQVLREENNLLKEENEELDGRIFELENLVSASSFFKFEIFSFA